MYDRDYSSVKNLTITWEECRYIICAASSQSLLDFIIRILIVNRPYPPKAVKLQKITAHMKKPGVVVDLPLCRD